MREERKGDALLDLLRERDDVALVELDDAVDVDLAVCAAGGVEGARGAVGGEVLGVEGGFVAEADEEAALDVGLCDEGREGGAVARADGGDEGGGVGGEFGLGDEFACVGVWGELGEKLGGGEGGRGTGADRSGRAC